MAEGRTFLGDFVAFLVVDIHLVNVHTLGLAEIDKAAVSRLIDVDKPSGPFGSKQTSRAARA